MPVTLKVERAEYRGGGAPLLVASFSAVEHLLDPARGLEVHPRVDLVEREITGCGVAARDVRPFAALLSNAWEVGYSESDCDNRPACDSGAEQTTGKIGHGGHKDLAVGP